MQLIPRHDPSLVVRSTSGVTVATLRGELDLVLVRDLRPELDALARESDALTVDIRGLTFCDASGLGLLAHCAGRMRRRSAHWRLVCDQPWILRLIRLTELGELLRPEAGPPDPSARPDASARPDRAGAVRSAEPPEVGDPSDPARKPSLPGPTVRLVAGPGTTGPVR
ncbi:STAS domain-containing protein [Streptomyces sp. NPDC058872]|uniref:STAS domain-containing protein n=1 Tax=Streptomyces sp. NPDC058872 TaxID=3346661 RepID=UPI0036C08BFD